MTGIMHAPHPTATMVVRRDGNGGEKAMPLWEALLEIAEYARNTRALPELVQAATNGRNHFASTLYGMSIVRPRSLGKNDGLELAYEGAITEETRRIVAGRAQSGDILTPSSLLMLQGMANLVMTTEITAIKTAIWRTVAYQTTYASAELAALQMASDAVDDVAAYAGKYIGWAERDVHYTALLLVIMAGRKLSVDDIRRYGADNVILAAIEEIRRRCGEPADTFEQALASLTKS